MAAFEKHDRVLLCSLLAITFSCNIYYVLIGTSSSIRCWMTSSGQKVLNFNYLHYFNTLKQWFRNYFPVLCSLYSIQSFYLLIYFHIYSFISIFKFILKYLFNYIYLFLFQESLFGFRCRNNVGGKGLSVVFFHHCS